MKHKYKFLLGLLVLPLFSSLFLVDCKKPRSGTKITFTADVLTHSVALQFFDPADPTTIIPVTMSLSGANAADVYEASGKKDFTVAGGVISVGITSATTTTNNNPVTFDVNASAPGYLPIKIPVTILPDQTAQVIKISMINVAHPPAGVTATQETTTLVDDSVATPIVVVTAPMDGSTEPSAKVSLPVGTTFNDDAGNPISGGEVVVTMVHFDTEDPIAAKAFPGGGLTSKSISKNGSTGAGVFSAAGCIDLGMSVGSTKVKTFNQPIEVTMNIDPTQINKATNAPYAAGDVLELYSYQVETGVWSYEAPVTITVSSGGGLEAKFGTSHLTAFTCANVSSVCPDVATLTFNINPADTNQQSFFMEIFYAGTNTVPVFSQVVNVKNGGTVSLSDAPSDPVDVYVYKNAQKSGAPLNTAMTAVTLCGGRTVNINRPLDTMITFDLFGYCPTTSKTVRPDKVAVYYRRTGSNASFDYLGTILAGKFATTSLSYLSTYDFQVTYNKVVHTKTKKVDSLSYNGGVNIPIRLEDNLCQ